MGAKISLQRNNSVARVGELISNLKVRPWQALTCEPRLASDRWIGS